MLRTATPPRSALFVAAALLAVIFTGCFESAPTVARVEETFLLDGLLVQRFASEPGFGYEVAAAAGAIGYFAPLNASATVLLPEGVLAFHPSSGRFSLEREHRLARGERLGFLVPPGASSLDFDVHGPEGRVLVVAETPSTGRSAVSGEAMYALMEVQRDEFPNRRPGGEGYAPSQQYFVEYFESLGMRVEVDPYGTMRFDDLPGLPPFAAKPSSLANVVAFKEGTANPPRYLILGGHYDVVEQTVEGALDNTAGTVAVMELARAFANVTTEHTLVFALWGGEEDGLLGSRFWVETNPEKVARTSAYFNLDVSGFAWPGPIGNPDPIVVTAGPDGPTGTALLADARDVVERWLRFDSHYYRFEPMGVGGQYGGSGVNAQSDHTSFVTKGVPGYFVFTGNVENALRVIHSPRDTLHNMTLYMMGREIGSDDYSAEEWREGVDLTARSFEAQAFVAYYYVLLADLGHYSPSAVPGPVSALADGRLGPHGLLPGGRGGL